ncbi:MAG: type VII toxin-antitoxin system HepT family RNase toxin [Anaerolineae bacterium]
MRILRQLRSLTFEEFVQDPILVSAVERNFQVAVQAALDIASIILADQSVIVPREYKDLFPALAEMGVLPGDFARRLVGMAKFRNVLVHLYLEIDYRRVYRYLQERLEDFEQFARYVSEWMERKESQEG